MLISPHQQTNLLSILKLFCLPITCFICQSKPGKGWDSRKKNWRLTMYVGYFIRRMTSWHKPQDHLIRKHFLGVRYMPITCRLHTFQCAHGFMELRYFHLKSSLVPFGCLGFFQVRSIPSSGWSVLIH